jgi:hypothetical protein
MDEPLPRLLKAAESAGVAERVHPLAEGESWIAPANLTEEMDVPELLSGTR